MATGAATGGERRREPSTILVVDDDEATRTLFRRILDRAGHTCHDAADAASALAVVHEHDVDLALVDLRLGEDDGLTLGRALLDRAEPVPVLLVSGVEDPDVAETALSAGAYGYLVKPVRRSELLLHVANAARRSALERAQRARVSDLEERVAARTAELQAALAHAEEAEAVRSQFVQNVSHELRSPLTVILAGAALLGRGVPTEDVATIGMSIETQGRLLLELVDRLLEVASLDPSSRHGDQERIDVRGLLALIAEPARRAGRTVTVQTSGDGVLLGSQRRLVAALGHVVDNALRFTPPDSPLLVTAEADPGEWVLRVVDHGPGLSGAIRHRLWEPFVQGDGSTVRTHGGLGVGLFLCRRLVEWHGGTVTADDTPGGGLTVTIRLPVPEEGRR